MSVKELRIGLTVSRTTTLRGPSGPTQLEVVAVDGLHATLFNLIDPNEQYRFEIKALIALGELLKAFAETV